LLGGIGMRKGFVFAAVALTLSSAAFASGGRSLPSGEGAPWAVVKLFSSPAGEVQFLEGNQGHTVFLRTGGGALFGLSQVRGSDACDAYLTSAAKGKLPGGCEFVLRDDFDGRVLTVKSEEMQYVAL
jgi:hypothetical protein